MLRRLLPPEAQHTRVPHRSRIICLAAGRAKRGVQQPSTASPSAVLPVPAPAAKDAGSARRKSSRKGKEASAEEPWEPVWKSVKKKVEALSDTQFRYNAPPNSDKDILASLTPEVAAWRAETLINMLAPKDPDATDEYVVNPRLVGGLMLMHPGDWLSEDPAQVFARLTEAAELYQGTIGSLLNRVAEDREGREKGLALRTDLGKVRDRIQSLAAVIEDTIPAKQPRKLAAAMLLHNQSLLREDPADVRRRLVMLEKYKSASHAATRLSDSQYDGKEAAEALGRWLAGGNWRAYAMQHATEHPEEWRGTVFRCPFTTDRMPTGYDAQFQDWEREQAFRAMAKPRRGTLSQQVQEEAKETVSEAKEETVSIAKLLAGS